MLFSAGCILAAVIIVWANRHELAATFVLLRARALPLQTVTAKLDRIAPVAGRGDVYSSVTVCCRLDEAPIALRPGMTGYARIHTGRRSIGGFIVDRVLRFVRTEFWW